VSTCIQQGFPYKGGVSNPHLRARVWVWGLVIVLVFVLVTVLVSVARGVHLALTLHRHTDNTRIHNFTLTTNTQICSLNPVVDTTVMSWTGFNTRSSVVARLDMSGGGGSNTPATASPVAGSVFSTPLRGGGENDATAPPPSPWRDADGNQDIPLRFPPMQVVEPSDRGAAEGWPVSPTDPKDQFDNVTAKLVPLFRNNLFAAEWQKFMIWETKRRRVESWA